MDTIIKLLLLSYLILYVKVNGQDVPDDMYVCLLPIEPQGSGNEAINLGWVLTTDISDGYDNCSITPGHSQALANCNAHFSGVLNSTDLSLDTDDRSFFNLCRNLTRGQSQFLFIPQITTALLTEMQTLGDCLLKQPYIPQFCQIEADEARAEDKSTFIILMGVFGGAALLLGMCLLSLKCREWNRQRDHGYDSLDQPTRNNKISFFSRICGGNNSNSVVEEANHINTNSAVQAGMFARAYHQVDAAVRSCIRPYVPNANLDTNVSASKSPAATANTPLL